MKGSVGVNTSTVVDIRKKRKNTKPIESNCKTCLYFNRGKCKFNKDITNRKYCIKYIYSKPNNKNQPKNSKARNKAENKQEETIKKTTYMKLSQFFGVPITYDVLLDRYRYYSKGYSLKKQSEEPLIIVLRNEKTRDKTYYEIVE